MHRRTIKFRNPQQRTRWRAIHEFRFLIFFITETINKGIMKNLLNIQMFTRICICIYIYIYIHTHTHTQTYTSICEGTTVFKTAISPCRWSSWSAKLTVDNGFFLCPCSIRRGCDTIPTFKYTYDGQCPCIKRFCSSSKLVLQSVEKFFGPPLLVLLVMLMACNCTE